jgi:hypothetical protein
MTDHNRRRRMPRIPRIRISRIRFNLILLWHWVCAQGRIIKKSPLSFYRAMGRRRDWVAAKVTYLQEESGKWKALFVTIKLPYTALRTCGLNPQAAAGILLASSAAGTGVIVNETILAEPSFKAGDHGVYTAPSDVPAIYSDANNTLRIDLGTTSVGEITIENVTVGTAYSNSALPAGQTNVVMVGGDEGESTYIEVGHLIIDRTRCTQLTIEDTETHTLNIKYNASDGQSIGPVAGTPRMRAIGGGNRADSMITSGGTYDQIRIGAPTNGVNGKVDVLKLSNLLTKGGPCLISRIKAGTIDILLNEIGAGDGFDAKDFVVATSTVAKIISIVDNVEESISPP